MTKKLIFGILSVAFLLCCAAGNCLAQEQIRGYINQVDLEQGTIALSPDKKLPPKIYSLASKKMNVVTSSGHKDKLGELKKGLYVTLTLSQADDVTQIYARSPRSYGFIKAIDAEQRTLIVKGITAKIPDRNVPLAEKADIYLHSKKAGLKQLYTGLYVLMDLSLDETAIVTARANLRRTAKDPRGVIVGMDAEKRMLTLLVGGETQPRTVTHPVAEDFKVVFDNKPMQVKLTDVPVAGSFSDLITAANVWCMLEVDKKTIVAIAATSRRLKGTIGKVEPAQRSFTMLLDGNVQLTFTAPKTAVFYVNGRAAAFKNLAPGMIADAQVAFDPATVMKVWAKVKQ